jgi:hypothetical protein
LNAMPIRIQRSRSKGWRMPENTVYVGRPSRWGNPYDWRNAHYLEGMQFCSDTEARATMVAMFREALGRPLMYPQLPTQEQIKELRGKNLACWCPLDQPCHADVLLELANQDALIMALVAQP